MEVSGQNGEFYSTVLSVKGKRKNENYCHRMLSYGPCIGSNSKYLGTSLVGGRSKVMNKMWDLVTTVQMEMAIAEIRRYQQAYIKVNNVSGILVRWVKGWYAVGKGDRTRFFRPTKFRNMIETLEARIK